MCNLPSGSYSNEASASRDAEQYANFTIPQAFKGTGFLIASLELRNQADSTFTMNAANDLRGLAPSTSAGGGAGITDHGDLAGLSDDDHTQYVLKDLFVPPNMTTTERDAIGSPVAGQMIYNTTTSGLDVYTSTWEAITSA
jgi:hypothetical protein